MARMNESHECQGCGMPSANFTTLFFGKHLAITDLHQKSAFLVLFEVLRVAPLLNFTSHPPSQVLLQLEMLRTQKIGPCRYRIW
jgi:hypothetical protein